MFVNSLQRFHKHAKSIHGKFNVVLKTSLSNASSILDFVPTKISGRECQRLVGNRTQPHLPQDKDEAMDKEMNLSQKNILTSSDGVQ